MTNRTDVLERLRCADPVSDTEEIGAQEQIRLYSMVDERRRADTAETVVGAGPDRPRQPRWAIVVIAAVVVALVGAAALVLVLRGSDGDPTTKTVGQPDSPTTEPDEAPAEPVPVPDPEWTTFTSATGLPGDDVLALDVNADGTLWAVVALDRETVDLGYTVDESHPGRLGFAVFDGNGWSTVEPPGEIEGLVRFAAGPDGTGWLVGGLWQQGGGVVHDMALGSQGLWFYDGSTWVTHFAERPAASELRPVTADSDRDGVLWSQGHSPDQPGPAVISFDGANWSVYEPPPFPSYLTGVEWAFGLRSNGNDVWAFLDDFLDPDLVAVRLARLDGETWTEFPGEWPVEFPDTMGTGYAVRLLDAGDGGFALLSYALPPFEPDPESDDDPAQVGDPIPYLTVGFDGTTWLEPRQGEVLIPENHQLDQQWPLRGLAADADTLYLPDLGGLTLLDRLTGVSTTFTTADGLASTVIREIVVDPTGSVWIATDAGISRYVAPTG